MHPIRVPYSALKACQHQQAQMASIQRALTWEIRKDLPPCRELFAALAAATLLLLAPRPAMAAQGPQLLKFRLTPQTRLILQKGDLTKYGGDAIVNAANERMLGGGGVDGAIHRAAGPRLLAECKKVPEVRPGVRCPTGEARITPGADLPARFVIHTVGPVYHSDEASAPLLASAYRSSLRLANQHGLKTIAFPAISCGVFGYPYAKAAKIALEVSKEEAGNLVEIQFVLFQDELLNVWRAEAEANFKQIEEDEGGEGQHRRRLEGEGGEPEGKQEL